MELAEAGSDNKQIGPFVVLRKLGEGSMGVVYAGYDVQLDRKVAIKLVHHHLLDHPEVRVRMIREAQAMARLSSPHVVHVYQVGEHDDGIYMAMEFIDGLTLRDWLRVRPRPWQQVLRTVCEAGRGLAAAHHAGLTHRDFKPENILVDAEDRARVLDFGLAQHDAHGEGPLESQSGEPTEEHEADEPHGSVRLTQRGKALGTPAYMSPEQHFGQPVDPLSDQYSFAITLYEALYGVRPFNGDSWSAIRRQVARGVVPPPPVELRVPKRVFRALARALAYRPEDRWPSLDAMLGALEHDPWRARLRVAGVVSLIGAASTASYLAAAQIAAPPRCQNAGQEWTDVWDEGRAAAVARAFAATRAPFAADVQARVQARLDAYVDAWHAAHRAACEANTSGAQSSHLMDLRIACLGRRRAQVSALVDIFSEADRGVVEHAVQAVAALPSVEACGDVEGLLTAVPPPAEPGTAARVETLRVRLARAASLEATGHYEQGLQLAAQVRAEARLLGYAPLDAEAALVEGSLRIVAARPEEADAALVDALRAAIAHDLHAVAAEAAAKRLRADPEVPKGTQVETVAADRGLRVPRDLRGFAPPAVRVDGRTVTEIHGESRSADEISRLWAYVEERLTGARERATTAAAAATAIVWSCSSAWRLCPAISSSTSGGPRSTGGASGSSSSSTSSSGASGSSGAGAGAATVVRSSFSSAITFLIDARMSSIDGSRDAMAGDIAYCCGGVTPDVTTGSVSVVYGTCCGVTIGFGGSSTGSTVRVETARGAGSLAQSFQLPATRR